MHETDALPLNVDHTTVYANCIFACYVSRVRKCVITENTASITDLVVIRYYKC